ncbi:MAG: type II toxin-antitoxin system HipA family toxin [Sulfurospirillaceae bacterium]|nr:type II toxin-antitoxin system HipA family toxin [Sulfurospirillaceae bacterium]MCK9545798.1 type II toxin-antitoxin system HipA family toxin [Sulfurospirillaceae bacterium]MDY0237624.1 type II toxin-antitoxin system HipA family toxin [Campylobacterales bacterium]NLM98955.1 type II toxin-antitoxin system HipA family toxin [Campylobacteraceae bacterium]
MIEIFRQKKLIASFIKDNNRFIIDYKNFDIENSIALSLPNTQKIYLFDYKFPPFLESFLPEGYLYEIFKNLLAKEHGRVDDYLIFSLLSSSIQSRIEFKSNLQNNIEFPSFNIDEILLNDTNDTFNTLLQTFLNKNAISGVQPKTVALLKEKLDTKEYIIKTWGEEYQDLALNEYFCLRAVQKAGVKTANAKLSKNNKFLIVEKFTLKPDGAFYGFEEILSLMDKNRDRKYDGSYEQIAKIIYSYVTNKAESMVAYYKTVVMNYLLKNGDAHLKNFGLLFDDDFKNIFYSPVYDVVNTVVYIYKDKPALMLNGKKIWHSKDALVKFGQKSCLLSQSEANKYYEECYGALVWAIEELESYLVKNPNFKIGKMMRDSWKLSLKEEEMKELDNETIRPWKNY